MSILRQLMYDRGYTVYLNTERDKTFPTIRRSTFRENFFKSSKEVVITIDEREVEGISDKNEIIAIYENMINKSLNIN